jgi:hypothetical protein
VQGYVEVLSSGPRISGSVVFGDPEQKVFSTALPLVSSLKKSIVFGQVASNDAYYTGIALLNTGETEAAVKVELFTAEGKPVGTKSMKIGPRQRSIGLLTQYFGDLSGVKMDAGYIRVTSDQGLAAFALFGTNALTALSAVPAQTAP